MTEPALRFVRTTPDGRPFVPDFLLVEMPFFEPMLRESDNYWRYDTLLQGYVGPLPEVSKGI